MPIVRWRVVVEAPEQEVESSVHVLEPDARAHVRRALEGIIGRMNFQMQVWRDRLWQMDFDERRTWRDFVTEALDKTEHWLERGDVWKALEIWNVFQYADERSTAGGEVGPPPFWPNVGRIRVETG